MEITLEQLKEIVNAGYHNSLRNIEQLKMYEDKGVYVLFDPTCMEKIAHLTLTDIVNIYTECRVFNHLAAIQKMRDLGLIKID